MYIYMCCMLCNTIMHLRRGYCIQYYTICCGYCIQYRALLALMNHIIQNQA